MIVVRITGHLLMSVSKLRGAGIGRGIRWNGVLLTRSWRTYEGEYRVTWGRDWLGRRTTLDLWDRTEDMVDRTFERSRHLGVSRAPFQSNLSYSDGMLFEGKVISEVVWLRKQCEDPRWTCGYNIVFVGELDGRDLGTGS